MGLYNVHAYLVTPALGPLHKSHTHPATCDMSKLLPCMLCREALPGFLTMKMVSTSWVHTLLSTVTCASSSPHL